MQPDLEYDQRKVTFCPVCIKEALEIVACLAEFQIGRPHPRPWFFMVMGATDNSWVGVGGCDVASLNFI
uniref:Uncharacterized protein n=1 Tax=Hyaloperonospora arabidopsidis (strain Emoy2) TaxID=559515 RepID=M4BTR7_HYAAE